MNKIHFVIVHGFKFLYAADVAKYIQEIAATEDVDTRKRLEEAAQNLLK